MARRQTIKKHGSRKNLTLQELVEQLITSCKDALDEKKIRVTVTDLIRMRDLKKEFYPAEAPTRKVTWIDPWD